MWQVDSVKQQAQSIHRHITGTYTGSNVQRHRLDDVSEQTNTRTNICTHPYRSTDRQPATNFYISKRTLTRIHIHAGLYPSPFDPMKSVALRPPRADERPGSNSPCTRRMTHPSGSLGFSFNLSSLLNTARAKAKERL